VVEVYNGTRIKQAMNLLSRTLKWSNDSHWEWATKPNPRERLLLSENILPMQSGQQFYQRPEGDYLEQSELGLEFFLLMVILISR
jgi:hypothetical protein